MKFQEKNLIYEVIRTNEVAIFGAGKEGRLALDVLISESIEILAVADNIVKKVMNRECILFDNLFDYDGNVVCVVTPFRETSEEGEEIKKHFITVVDSWYIHL